MPGDSDGDVVLVVAAIRGAVVADAAESPVVTTVATFMTRSLGEPAAPPGSVLDTLEIVAARTMRGCSLPRKASGGVMEDAV